MGPYAGADYNLAFMSTPSSRVNSNTITMGIPESSYFLYSGVDFIYPVIDFEFGLWSTKAFSYHCKAKF